MLLDLGNLEKTRDIRDDMSDYITFSRTTSQFEVLDRNLREKLFQERQLIIGEEHRRHFCRAAQSASEQANEMTTSSDDEVNRETEIKTWKTKADVLTL